MSQVPRGNFNAQALYNKIEATIEEDRRYWLRNDAKIRASMSSQSYDEFRDIVAAAHLSPLDRADKRTKANLGWNKYVSRQGKPPNNNTQ